MKIVSVGDNVIDFYEDLQNGFPGGNAVNVSVFLKRLGVERSKYIGIIGNDNNGKLIVSSLKNENVDVENIRVAVGETGLTSVTLNEKGDRFFNNWNKGGVQAELKLNFTESEFNLFKEYDLLHSSIYSYLENEIEFLSEKIDISFDFSTNYDLKYLEQICPYIKYAFFSAEKLSNSEIEKLMRQVHKLGTKHCVVTLGEKGAMMSVNGEKYYQAAYPTKVIDTLGAGDSFIASILYYMHKTSDVNLVLEKSNRFASKTCEYYGAF